MGSSTNTARLAGLLWVLTAVTGDSGLFTIRSRVLVPGDAAATAGNIMSSESLYRAAIVSTLVSQMLLFFLGLILFRLFREVDKRLAAVLLASVMMTVGLAIMNTLNHFEALMLLSQAEFLKAFTPPQLDALAMASVRLANGAGQGLVEIFWAPYYISFGLLVLRSGFLPKILGILLVAMGAGFAINILRNSWCRHSIRRSSPRSRWPSAVSAEFRRCYGC